MTDTRRLLKFDPAVAVLIMANNHFNINLRSEFASVGAPTVVDGTLTEVLISTHDSIDENIYRAHTGQMTYRYDRLDLRRVFGDLYLDLVPPVTVAGVMNNISQATGLVVTADDFENALIKDSTFILTAKPESLRWVGVTSVSLPEPAEDVLLAEAFPDNILDGLIPPNYTLELDQAFPNNVLDGLIPPSY